MSVKRSLCYLDQRDYTMSTDKASTFKNVKLEGLRQRSLQGGVVTLCSQALKFFLQTGSTMIMARLLTPADFGVVAMVSSLLGFVNLLKDFGLTTATIQKASLSHEELSGIFWINLVSSLGLMVVLVICSPFVAAFYGEPTTRNIAMAFGVLAVLNSLGAQHSSLLLRQMRFGAIAACDLSAMMVGIIFGVTAAWCGLQFWALVLAQAANAISGTIFLWWRSGWRPGKPRRITGLFQIVKFGGSLTIADFLAYANHNLDNILLGKYFGDISVGIYSKAQGLLNRPLEQVLPPAMRVALPMFSRLVDNPSKFKKAALQLTEIVCFGGCMLTMLVIPTADWFVDFLLGAQWGQAVPVFQLLSVFGLIEPLSWLLGTIIVASGRPEVMIKWRAVTMVVVFLSFIAGLPWGILGVAAGYAFSGIITRTWLIFFLGNRIGISGWQFLSTCAPFVVLAGSVALALAGLRSVWEPGHPITGLVAYISLGTIAYLGCLGIIPKGRRFFRDLIGFGKETLQDAARPVPRTQGFFSCGSVGNGPQTKLAKPAAD
jgi:PST family polysaccharide transporter